jgi:hypothetical protein
MNSGLHDRGTLYPSGDSQPQSVNAPDARDGLKRALLGSFRSPVSLPDEFTRLLAKLR